MSREHPPEEKGDAPLSPVVVDSPRTRTSVTFEPGNFWRNGLVAASVVALGAFLWFVLDDGGSVIFTLLISWFAALAMEPAVAKLGHRMKRGTATLLVILSAGLFLVLFGLAFGNLIAEQLIQAVKALPSFAANLSDWINRVLGTDYTGEEMLTTAGITQDTVAAWGKDLVGGVLGLVVSALGALFSSFTFVLFTFYFSADAPRLKRWIAALFPVRSQPVFVTTWDLAVEKTGGYVSARVVLAFINGSTTSLFMLLIGMPYWLVLGIWTGVVAQFVPTIGTYIAIILPTVGRPAEPRPHRRGARARPGGWLPAGGEPHDRAADQRQGG